MFSIEQHLIPNQQRSVVNLFFQEKPKNKRNSKNTQKRKIFS